MGMKQITVSDGRPVVFRLVRREDGLWLGSAWARPYREWRSDIEFVFRLRSPEASKQVSES